VTDPQISSSYFALADTRHPVAAPQVSGLLAYFLSLETVPFDTSDGALTLNALNFLKDTASWVRTPGGPKVAWNLVTEDENPPSS